MYRIELLFKKKINLVFTIITCLSFCFNQSFSQTPFTDTTGKGSDSLHQKKIVKWNTNLMASFGFNAIQAINWSNGTSSNYSVNYNTRLTSAFDNKKRTKFVSETITSFGYNRDQDKIWQKNMDMLYTQNIFYYSLNDKKKNWYLAGIFDLSTQLFNGYSYSDGNKFKISSLLSPGFITEGTGILYMNNVFYFGVAPAALNHYFIIDKSISASFHSIKKDRFATDAGALIKTGYYKYLFKSKVYFNTISTLFKDYNSADLVWTANGTARISLTKWLSINSDFSLMYNDKQNSLVLITDQSGMPTGINTGSPKLQSYINYGFGINLKL